VAGAAWMLRASRDSQDEETAPPTNYQLRGLRRGPEVELLLQVRGVQERKSTDRAPVGDRAEVRLEAGTRIVVRLRPSRRRGEAGGVVQPGGLVERRRWLSLAQAIGACQRPDVERFAGNRRGARHVERPRG